MKFPALLDPYIQLKEARALNQQLEKRVAELEQILETSFTSPSFHQVSSRIGTTVIAQAAADKMREEFEPLIIPELHSVLKQVAEKMANTRSFVNVAQIREPFSENHFYVRAQIPSFHFESFLYVE